MRQIVRRVIDRKGRVAMIEVPEPHIGPEQILVQNAFTLISTGTELGTLKKTPTDLVRQTIEDPWMRHVVKQTLLATGPRQTAQRVWHEMVVPREIGYSGAGKVLKVGHNVDGFRVGDTVAIAATGHAELVAPHLNHVVAVPENVPLRHAAFVTVGGIALQSIRRAELVMGEVVAVIGMGLVGQMTARLAKSAGCVVVGIDINPAMLSLASDVCDFTVNPAQSDIVRRVTDLTGKNGADATIICAASKSKKIINQAMEITRRQGRVVIVGYVKLNIHPKNFFHREIDLRYSRAYGPGSYHTGYEKGRLDYPFGYVRWTEQRNLREVIRQMATGRLDVEPLIGGVFPLEQAQAAFDQVSARTLPGAAALIDYDIARQPDRRKTLEVRRRPRPQGKVGISIIGCGNHVLGKHLPNLRRMKEVQVRGLVSATGRNAITIANKIDATVVTTDVNEVLSDGNTDAVMICSGQPDHFEHLKAAIAAGKSIFVEKPMVTRLDHFTEIYRLMQGEPVLLTLGLNRRYAPLVEKLLKFLDGRVDSVTYTVSQPFVPPDHWTLDEVNGGGRLITEGEHFLDICNLLIKQEPLVVFARPLGDPPEDIRALCNYAVTVHYEQAVANLIFSESGSVGFPREKIEVLGRAQAAVLNDFSRLTTYGARVKTIGGRTSKAMGHSQELKEFVSAILGRPNRLLSWKDSALATLMMFAAQQSLTQGEPVYLRDFRSSLENESVFFPEEGERLAQPSRS